MTRPTFEPLQPHELAPQGSSLLAYLRLMRLPNVFTALADVAMGFAFVRDWSQPFVVSDGLLLACLAGASGLLYTAGMVLNDVYDLDVDRQERPARPLPSGRISLSSARGLGYTMLLLGVALGWLAGVAYGGGEGEAPFWRSGAVATALAGCVLLYNLGLKRTLLGPLGMGACRFLNVLLGMSVAYAGQGGTLGYYAGELLAAGGIGLYVVGITWFARNEAGDSSQVQLGAALVVMAAGIALLGSSLRERIGLRMELHYFWILLGILLLTVVRRGIVAVLNPEPQAVQATVKHSILSLIVFDAAVCMAVAPTGYSLSVLALLAPALLLGRWVYST